MSNRKYACMKTYDEPDLSEMSVDDFIAKLKADQKRAIEDGFTSVSVELSCPERNNSCCDGCPELDVYAHREENAEEKSVREKQEKEGAQALKNNRRTRYLELKKEFGNE